jgi:integrase
LAEQAGRPPIILHGLRHGAAGLMLAAGWTCKVVQETLGHSMLSLTADTLHLGVPAVAAQAAEAAEALVPLTDAPPLATARQRQLARSPASFRLNRARLDQD